MKCYNVRTYDFPSCKTNRLVEIKRTIWCEKRLYRQYPASELSKMMEKDHQTVFFWAFHWPLQVGWPYRHTHMVSLFPSLKKPHCVRFGGIWKAVLCGAASPLQMPRRTSDFSVVSTSPERLKSVLKKQKMILLGCCVRAREWEKDQRLRMMSLHTFSTLKGCRLKAAIMYYVISFSL